ncbi:MAG: hypothetical protein ACTHLA_12440 [Asticcacaulis sp.]|uniref:hypothetical protein n=1 Tax=Asticcacaulis sp. TaxID=1872648 RepID=UPI003F7B9E57
MTRMVLLLTAALTCCAGPVLAQTAAPSTDAQPAPLLTPDTPVASMPRWSEFPVPPDHTTPLSEFAARVRSLNQMGAQLAHDEAQIHWPTITPEALHAQILARIDPAKMAPIDPMLSQKDIEAFAAKQRARATPPPVVQ